MQLEMDFETPVIRPSSLAKGVPELKVCKTCKEEKPLSAFYKDRLGKDGLRNDCKSCTNKKSKKHYQKNRDSISEQKKTWRKANSELVSANSASRRARKKQAQPPWLTEEHINQIKVEYKNSKRMKKLTGIEHHVDHIVPLKGENVCGLHVPWNLQVIPAKHNLEKKNHFDDWNLNDG
jgi:hypothetical protein